jgi:hypothetical protein
MINITQIFDKYQISWRDHGKNVAGDNIVISCCFCNKTSSPDPGEHLAISRIGEYYCFRNPRHGGHNLVVLFKALGLPKSTYENIQEITVSREYKPEEKDYSQWNYFTPAWADSEAIEYLRSRLFTWPEEIARKFNLRVAKEGNWCGRLLIPLTIGWTGRAMRSHIEPRYDAYTNEEGFFYHSHDSSSAIILEGAIDCMRVASVTTQFDTYGKCRMQISAAMFNQLRERKYQSIWSSPDSTVTFMQAREEISQLRSYCTRSYIGQIKNYKKDFGATSETETRSILRRVGYDSHGAVLRQSI